MIVAKADTSASSAIAPEDIASFVFAISAGRVSLLSGVGPPDLHSMLEDARAAPRSRALFVDIAPEATAQALIDQAIVRLAEIALRMWPLWYSSEDLGQTDASTLSRAALHIRLDALQARLPDLSTTWALAAIRDAGAGRPPKRSGANQASDITQLCLALGRPIIVAAWSNSGGAKHDSYVAAMEWLARTAGVPVLVLCAQAPPASPPFDRWPRRSAAHAAARMDEVRPAVEADSAEIRTWLAPVVGQPHPFSDIEKKLARWLQDDDELQALFAFNQPVRSLHGRVHKVDLLWETGRVVVEIDGYADHNTRSMFRDDRHRDYELLMAGYRVLRITNDEVEDDCGRVIEKIRGVVRAQG